MNDERHHRRIGTDSLMATPSRRRDEVANTAASPMPAAAPSSSCAAPQTTKTTTVTKQTTDTLPQLEGMQPAALARPASEEEEVLEDGHRLRKKYTVTTVTTITTTCILLPRTHDEPVRILPSITQQSHEQASRGQPLLLQDHPDNTTPCAGAATPSTSTQRTEGVRREEARSQGQPSTSSPLHPTTRWAFNQHHQKSVSAAASHHRPTLEELGLTSYFGPASTKTSTTRATRPQPQPRQTENKAGRGLAPIICEEQRAEVEGGQY